ncbi:acyl-CoA thioesterase [Ktedonosporobacter rubrisoli]|uniref:Acyl-CoA thioesterase n=1 Tax=Ktedonosporobacter rubrisoli TaxID=2509675 RepID=A0A4P6K428_KTERU|nr:acyl-CoA thioesterase [Ktedonosporobacter rubrisoli]QBD82683.1 acyl-CoA thioesterase [Ktedonosporobacter rubrisoli]
MNPFERIVNRYKNLPKVDLTQGRSIAYSRSITRRAMELIDANSQGNVHGGVIMRMVDEAAGVVAIKHSQCPTVVTARVERFDFLAPAFIGDVVSVNCEMHYVGRTSMEVGVEVTAEDLITREVRRIASSYVIYVALDENRKPTPVPPLVPADDEEEAIIERARIRRLHRQRIDEELKQIQEISSQNS